MKRYLTDTEMLNWNSRLENTPYSIIPRYHTHNSYPMIHFIQKLSGPFSHSGDTMPTLDPSMKFQFSFSVAKNRVDNFFHIFNKWFTEEVETKVIYDGGNDREKINNIQVSHSIIQSKSQSDHFVKEKEYTKFTYNFSGYLSSIMAYVMFLEDTIEIFSKVWGYDENGIEHQLTKFTIGDIVTKTGNQTEDYIVLDHAPIKVGNSIFVDYEISKMIIKGQIIQYGEIEQVTEKELAWSRNNRIDDILDI